MGWWSNLVASIYVLNIHVFLSQVKVIRTRSKGLFRVSFVAMNKPRLFSTIQTLHGQLMFKKMELYSIFYLNCQDMRSDSPSQMMPLSGSGLKIGGGPSEDSALVCYNASTSLIKWKYVS